MRGTDKTGLNLLIKPADFQAGGTACMRRRNVKKRTVEPQNIE
jgi:hypothetical protein